VRTEGFFRIRVEIFSGLAAGEQVGVSKTDHLRDGARVWL
jgi:hypothetical protein